MKNSTTNYDKDPEGRGRECKFHWPNLFICIHIAYLECCAHDWKSMCSPAMEDSLHVTTELCSTLCFGLLPCVTIKLLAQIPVPLFVCDSQSK